MKNVGFSAFRLSFNVLARPFSAAHSQRRPPNVGLLTMAPFVPRSTEHLAQYLASNVIYHSVGDVLVVDKPYGVGSLGYVQKDFGIFPTTQYKFKGRLDIFNQEKTDDSVTLMDAIPHLREIFNEPNLHFCTGLKRWVSGPVVLPCSNTAFGKIRHSLFQGESISHNSENWKAQHMHKALAICISRPPQEEGVVEGYATFQDTGRAKEYIFMPSIKANKRARYGKFAVQGGLFYRVLASQFGLSLVDVHFSKFSRHFPRLILSHLGSPIFGDWTYERRLLDIDGSPIIAEPKDVWRGDEKKYEPSALLKKLDIDSLEELGPHRPLFLAVYESTLHFFGNTKAERRKTNLVSRTPPPAHFLAMVDLLGFNSSVDDLLSSCEMDELKEAKVPSPKTIIVKNSGETKF